MSPGIPNRDTVRAPQQMRHATLFDTGGEHSMKPTVLRIAAGVMALGALAPAVHANEQITLMVGGTEKQIYLPATLAARLGYFKEQGLEVELVNEAAGVDAENELIA